MNAGHNPPILLPKIGPSVRLGQGGLLLGPFADATYDESDVLLSPQDRLVLYTDGITEAMNARGEFFGEERLIELVLRDPDLSAQAVVERIFAAVADFSAGESEDDASLLLLIVH